MCTIERSNLIICLNSYRWFLAAYVCNVWERLPQLLAAATSVYGSVLKIDSTKKICIKKLQAGTATLRADTLHVSRTTTSTLPITPTGESSSPVTVPRDFDEVRGSNFKAATQDPTQISNTNGDHDDEPSSWGETKEFCGQMVNANQESLGSAISPGTLPRIQINSTYSSSIPGSIFIS